MAILKNGFYQTKSLTFEEKAIIRTILDGLEIQRNLDILEISAEISIADEGLFDKFKCHVLTLTERNLENRNMISFSNQKIDTLSGGEYDLIFIFNYADEKNVEKLLKYCKTHICKSGKIVFINTRSLIIESKLSDSFLAEVDNVLTSANFSLYIVNF